MVILEGASIIFDDLSVAINPDRRPRRRIGQRACMLAMIAIGEELKMIFEQCSKN
jgi:hypothetical protein